MKKYFVFTIALTALALFTSCEKDDQGCGLVEHTYRAVGSDCWLTDYGYDLNCNGRLDSEEKINSFPVADCPNPKAR